MKYDPSAWKIAFQDSEIYNKLVKEFDVVFFDKKTFEKRHEGDLTPREEWAYPQSRRSYFSAIPFYYIEWLQEINPEKVYDLGCGWNIFKKYYPNIIGVGIEDQKNGFAYWDIFDYVDDDYILGHQEYFESVFSICALHFIPLSDIRKRALGFASMIKSGGRGWLSFNVNRMITRDPIFKNKIDFSEIQDFCKEELSDLPNCVSLDIDFTPNPNSNTGIAEADMDGNIHILFNKRRN